MVMIKESEMTILTLFHKFISKSKANTYSRTMHLASPLASASVFVNHNLSTYEKTSIAHFHYKLFY